MDKPRIRTNITSDPPKIELIIDGIMYPFTPQEWHEFLTDGLSVLRWFTHNKVKETNQ